MKNTHKGFASLDVGIAIIVVLFITMLGANTFSDYTKSKENKVIAQKTSQIGNAAKQYIKQNYNALFNSTAGGAVAITLDTLKASGLLPQGVTNLNSFGQNYQIKVVRNKKDNSLLDAMLVTSGGSPLDFKSMTQISKDITGLGGYINNSTEATGAMGSWKMTLSDFNLTSTQGHVAVALTADVLDSVNQESDRLYRYAVNGRPELNQMKTSIDMGNNNLNNANAVNGVSGKFTGNVTAGSVTAGSANVTGNVSAGTANVNGGLSVGGTGSFTGSIYTNGNVVTYGNTGWQNGTYGGGFYMSDNDWVRLLNNKNLYTAGQLRGGTLRADGRLSTGEVLQLDGVSGEGNGCSPNGLISRDSTGAILSCVNGAWAKSGAGKPGYYCRYTSMSEGKSWDYVGLTPVADKRCPVIGMGVENGQCSCMKVMLDY